MSSKIIADLIAVPPVETVIRLEEADSADSAARQKLLGSFVITDEIEQVFEKLFGQILRRQGVGAFLKGNYGSGKSHLLAVLSLLLQSPKTWKLLDSPLLKPFSELQKQKILTVKIALHNFAAGERLEAILLGETEKALAAAGKEVLLQSAAVLVEDFNRYILPQHPDFPASLKESERSWKALAKSEPKRAAGLVYRFITQNQIPLKPAFDRREAILTLLAALKEEGIAGVFFAVDELSEFLKSKPGPAAFSEDLRFLQFMGEACKDHPFYLVAALQENIENTGYIEKDLVYRIKDRFPLRFSLSSRHVKQLISQRLIHKKPNAAPQIETIYRDFRAAFPKIETGPREFCDIYPVHPDTVILLEGLTPLFSQHRGVVDFIYHQLTGDPNRGWEGMMSLPANQLMTADAIFDHFRERIREIPDLNPFVEVVFKTLEREIPRIFEDSRDQRIAFKTVKILILVELSPLEKRLSLSRLAQMVNEPVSNLEESLNYRYLEEAILERLLKEGSFVSRQRSESGETLYFISLEMTAHQVLRSRIGEFLKEPARPERELPRLFPYLKNTEIPLEVLTASPRKKYSFSWQNTNREGWVIYKPRWSKSRPRPERLELEELQRELLTSEADFALFICGPAESEAGPENGSPEDAPPADAGSAEDGFSRAILLWAPRGFREDETRFIHEFYAYDLLRQQLEQAADPREKQMLQIVREWLEEHRNELTTIVEDAYYGGRLADAGGWTAFRFMSFYSDFKSLLKQIFSAPLQTRYPRHGEIMPGDAIPPFAQDKLFQQFIRPGSISRQEAQAQHLDALIESCLKPLGIVEADQEQYTLSLIPKENSVLGELLSLCAGDQPVNPYNLYWEMRKGPWGISKAQFSLLLGALLTSGKLAAFQSGNVAPLRTIAQLSDGSIDAVGQGKLISEEIQRSLLPLLQLPEFREIPPHFSASAQEQVWRKLKGFREDLHALQGQWQAVAERYQAYPAYPALVQAQAPDISLLNEFEEALRVSHPAKEGLEKLAGKLRPAGLQQFAEAVQKLKKITRLLENRFVELNQIYVYLKNPHLKTIAARFSGEAASGAGAAAGTSPMGQMLQALENLYSEMSGSPLLSEESVQQFTEKFYQFRAEYTRQYCEAHKAYYSDAVFEMAENLATAPAVQVLRRFHQLETMVFEPDWISVQEKIGQLPRPCRRRPEAQLAAVPLCECGFIPGQKSPEAGIEEIVSMAVEGIRAVLGQLQTTFRWAVEEYESNLKRVGKVEPARQLSELLNFPLDKTETQMGKLAGAASEAAIEAINEGIRGKVLVLQRSIKKLTAQLAGKQKTVREVQDIFRRWLSEGETLSEETHVQILAEQESPDFDLRSYQGVRFFIREEGARFFEAFWLLVWASQHETPPWLEWIKNKYRIQQVDFVLLDAVARERMAAGDWERFLLYWERSNLPSQLEKLVQPGSRTAQDLLRFISRENMLEGLSRKAAQLAISRVAPTESLPESLAAFPEALRKHARFNSWAHLRFLERYLAMLQLAGAGESGAEPVAFYLDSGWKIPLLLNFLEEGNQGLQLLPAERFHLLRERAEAVMQQLYFPLKNIPRREIRLPFFDVYNFPKRLGEIIAEGNRPIILLIIDAMRWDVWEILQPLFARMLPRHSPHFYGAMETASPTTTEKNRKLLIENLADITRVLAWSMETVSEDPSRREEVIRLARNVDGLLILNTTIVDTLLHERKEPLGAMLEVMKTRMNALMGPVLQAIPPEVTLVLTADHGFVEAGGGYRHGGDSFFEKIVPFTVWKA